MSANETAKAGRTSPVLAAVSIVMTIMASIMYYAFKLALDVRHTLEDEAGKEALDRTLTVLATERVFAVVAVIVAVVALMRREDRWGILALVISLVGNGARFAYM